MANLGEATITREAAVDLSLSCHQEAESEEEMDAASEAVPDSEMAMATRIKEAGSDLDPAVIIKEADVEAMATDAVDFLLLEETTTETSSLVALVGNERRDGMRIGQEKILDFNEKHFLHDTINLMKVSIKEL
jgi:hypothetical protein